MKPSDPVGVIVILRAGSSRSIVNVYCNPVDTTYGPVIAMEY